MFDPTAIEEVKIKEESHDFVFDVSEEAGSTHPNRNIKAEKCEANFEDIRHYSVEVDELLETRNVCLKKCSISKKSKQEIQIQPNIFYCCNFCNSKFEARSFLKKHLLNHAVRKLSACTLCNCAVLQTSYLRYLSEDGFICGTCNLIKNNLVTRLERKSFSQNEGFLRQLKKKFFCKVCDYKCTRNSSLQVHLRIHSGEKPFSCKICDYKCTDKRNLQRHLRIHTGEKPYMCTICDYKCADKSSLRIHSRIHTGEKPFVCDYCDYKSIDKRNLRRHLAIHTGEKPHSCEICNYKTVNKRNLRRHLKVHT